MYAVIKNGVVINVIEIDTAIGDRQKSARAAYASAMRVYESNLAEWEQERDAARRIARDETEQVRSQTGNKRAIVPAEIKTRQPAPPHEPPEIYAGPFEPPPGCEIIETDKAFVGALYENGEFTRPA